MAVAEQHGAGARSVATAITLPLPRLQASPLAGGVAVPLENDVARLIPRTNPLGISCEKDWGRRSTLARGEVAGVAVGSDWPDEPAADELSDATDADLIDPFATLGDRSVLRTLDRHLDRIEQLITALEADN